MRRPTLTNHMVPIGEFRANVAQWLHRLDDGNRPVVLTQRGKAAAVLVKPEMLDELEEEREVVRMVLRGLHDIEAGKHVADSTVWAEVDRIVDSASKRNAH